MSIATFARNRSYPFLYLLLALCSLLLAISCRKEKDDECEPSVAPAGTRLAFTQARQTFSFQTSGGATISIKPDTSILITHTGYPGFKLEFWGAVDNENAAMSHENLNGKHVKDWVGNRRTFILPDGAKITMVAQHWRGPLITLSIYHGEEFHRVNFTCNILEYSVISGSKASEMDATEADGETATIEMDAVGLNYVNIYTEATPGNKVMKREPIGRIERDKPSTVNDYYDDPNLGHT